MTVPDALMTSPPLLVLDFLSFGSPGVFGVADAECIWWKLMDRVHPTCVVIDHPWRVRGWLIEAGMANWFLEISAR